MAIVSALVFTSAVVLIAMVMAGTLMPSWDRVLSALAGQPLPQPRLVPVRRQRLVTPDRRARLLAERLREAA